MQTVTLDELRDLIAERASQVIAPSARHTTAQIDPLINESIRRYWLLVFGDSDWANKPATATTSAATTSTNGWDANRFVALASDFLLLKDAEVYDGASWITMLSFDTLDRDTFDSLYWTESDMPTFARVAMNNAGTPILELLPRADAVYTIRYWYVASPTELVNDSDTFSFADGSLDYVVCDVAMRILTRDGVPESDVMQLLKMQRDEALSVAQKFARIANRMGPRLKHDTRGMRRRNRLLASSWRGV